MIPMHELDPKDGGLQRVVLITQAGGRREMLGYRQWGSITVNGRRFVAARMHDSPIPGNCYIEDGRTT